MNLPMRVYPRNIPAAARTLDKVDPEWYTKINLDTLRMVNSDSCILGQLYTDYYDGFKQLFGEERDIDTYACDAVFGIHADDSKWKEEIHDRLNPPDKSDIDLTSNERTQLIALVLGQPSKLTDKQKLALVVKLGQLG